VLCDLITCKAAQNITDTSQDAWLSALIPAADAVIKNYCKQNLETLVGQEFRDGAGIQALPLYRRPVKVYTLTGTLTQGSPVVTGISSTANLLVGMPAVAQNPRSQGSPAGISTTLPAGAQILTVDSPTQVTLTWPAGFVANAQTSGSFAILFGLDVDMDAQGLYGQGPGGFSQVTRLIMGVDYSLKVDQPDGSSKSALLLRLSSGISGGPLPLGGWPQDLRRGTLTARLPPCWPIGTGNVWINYCSGYGLGPNLVVGATSGSVANLPQDLVIACATLVAYMKRTIPLGSALNSEVLGRYTYVIYNPPPGAPPDIGTLRQILSRYRDLSA
jgi:hypothetical protein